MRRQKIRKALIFISFLLFPVTIYLLSPVLIIMGASQGIITGSLVIFTLLFLSSLFLGRGFCGWVCPAAGLQECCFAVVNRKARGGRLNWIKYFIWVPWVSVIAAVFITAGGFKQVQFFYQMKYGISVAEPGAYIIYYFFIALIVVLAFTAGKRAFCHYICWAAPFMVIGSKLRNFLGLPTLGLRADQDKCAGCKRCNDRCPMSLDVENKVRQGSMMDSECILCGECVDGCPKSAITFAFGAVDKSISQNERMGV